MFEDEDDDLDIPELDLHALGGRALGIAGAFGSLVIVSMPKKVAEKWFPEGIAQSGHKDVLAGVERDVAAIELRDQALAKSGLAMSALALAWDMTNPYTSATARSMCAARLAEALDKLNALAPPSKEADEVDAIADGRAERRAAHFGGSEAPDM